MSAIRAATTGSEAPGGGDALILEDVSFACGPCPSGHFSIRVGCGEAVGLLGPRGAGKMALLRVVAGESKPLTGRIWTHQMEITDLGRRGRQDAGVFVCFHDRRRLRVNRSMLEIVATAIHREPKVLIVDEPFQRLEGPLGRRALSALLEMCRNAGVGVLISDHDVRAALPLVDRAYIVHEGKIVVEGTTDYLLGQQDD